MKIRIAIVFLSLLVIPLVPEAQEKPAPTFKIKVTAEQANIRDTPDIGSPVIQQLPEGTVLEAEKKEGEWYMVRFTRDDGLVARGYIHESLVLALEPVPVQIVRAEHPAAEPPAAKTFGFSIFSGVNFTAVGDLNAGARGLADYYSAVSGTQGKGGIAGLHLAYILGAEVSYSLLPGFHLIVGMDYFSGRRTSRVDFAADDSPDAIITRPRVQAIPIKVGIAYYPLPSLYAKGTLQYLFAKAHYFYRLEKGTFWREWQGDAKASGLGAEAALGGEWEFYPGLLLVGEVEFRFAKIGGFEGKDISTNSEGESYAEHGTLYYFKGRVGSQEGFPLVFIRSDMPSGADVNDPREAQVDFSGISLKAGIRIRF